MVGKKFCKKKKKKKEEQLLTFYCTNTIVCKKREPDSLSFSLEELELKQLWMSMSCTSCAILSLTWYYWSKVKEYTFPLPIFLTSELLNQDCTFFNLKSREFNHFGRIFGESNQSIQNIIKSNLFLFPSFLFLFEV